LPVFVRDGHQQHAAATSLNILLGSIGRQAGEHIFQHVQRGLEHRLYRQHVVTDAEVVRLSRCVVAAHLRRVAARHHDGLHALGAERVDGDRQRQCRIDAARQPEHDARETILLDVVARTEHERSIDALR
jgi:hypothetical protein